MPVREGLWKQHELWDGTYTLGDWISLLYQIPKMKKDKTDILSLFLGAKNGN